MPLHNGASAKPRQYWRKLSATLDALDQSARNVPQSEISWSGRKHAGQSRAHSGKRPNPENAGSVFSPFRPFAVSPFRSCSSPISGQLRKPRRQHFPNFLLDLVCIARTIDQDDALWLARRELAISFANALIKFGGLLFHPISFARLLPHSCLRRRSIDIEHESNIGDAIADGERIQALDHLSIQFACCSLIDRRGIEKSIGDHAHAAFKRRLNYLAHELAAAGLKK